MIEVMLYEKTYLRVAAEFDRRAHQVRPVILTDEGKIFRNGGQVTMDSVHPEIAWASVDLIKGEAGALREFMRYALLCDSIRWLQSGAGGFDNLVFTMLADKGVRLTRNNASHIAVAEFVVFHVLNHYQREQTRIESEKKRQWQRLEFREIFGTTWLIVGMGGIGTEISRRASAFGAFTIGVKRTVSGGEPADSVVEPKALFDCLPEADVVVLSAPLNIETEMLVDGEFLDRMRRDSVLINIARGGLVDDDALLKSLDAGRPALAVLDVFHSEPLTQDSPFWSHPRVRVASHSAGAGSGSPGRGDALFFDNLDRYLSNHPLRMEIHSFDLGR